MEGKPCPNLKGAICWHNQSNGVVYLSTVTGLEPPELRYVMT